MQSLPGIYLKFDEHCIIGRIDIGGQIKKVTFTYSDTLFSLYFSIRRQVCFLAFFYLRTPSFANFVYIADLHGEGMQNISGGDLNVTHHLQITLLL